MVYLSKEILTIQRMPSPIRGLARWLNPAGLKQKRLRRNKFGLKLVGRLLVGCTLVGVVMTATLFAYYSKDLPTPGKIAARQVIQSTQILDRNGKLLYEIHGEQNRSVIPLDQIPKISQQATLAAEDANFYHEYGFSPRGILRSIFVDVFTHSASQGGSTITQQYVKNALLSSDKSIARKIKELILSVELESIYSKDQILAFYLNEIPYGSSAYGIQVASQTFFNQDAKNLDLAQSAVLAAMLNAPTYYSPYGDHKPELIDRQHYILDRMVSVAMVSQADADTAKAEPLNFASQTNGIKAPHFSLYVKQLLVDKYGEKEVEQGGLKVTTSLDLAMQQKAEQAVTDNEKQIIRNGGSNAALVAMDPKTGQVIAMVGSFDYFDTAHDGNVNVALAKRQPGSSFKPIVYATAFKGKYNPAFTLWDVPTDFGNYKPNNFDGSFHGPVSMRFALQNSLNIPAVKTLGLVGVEAAIKTAQDLGITTLTDPSRYGLSLVLGGGEVKLLELVDAYSTFANQGVNRDPTVILKVQDSAGKVLEQFDNNRGQRQALDPQVAYEISNVLSDNPARATVFGTHSPLAFTNRPVAAKTGTTENFRDGWTIGYTPSLATGVWVGNNDGHSLRSGADGVVVAAPIFHQFMAAAMDGWSIEQFQRPAEIKDVTVDKLSNKLPGSDSPETITDIFTRWQIPTERDNIHVKVSVNKKTGWLATQFTPAELVEERLYTNLHSELPSNPNWENPVLDWARGHGIAVSTPPTDKDATYTESNRPMVSFTNPTEGQAETGPFLATMTTGGTVTISQVELFLDGASIGTKVAAPYQLSVSTSGLSIGSHSLKAVATDENGGTVSASVSFSISQLTTAPAEVSTLAANPANSAAVVSWHNPVDVNLAKVHLYLATVPGQLGTLYPTEILVQPNSNTTITVSGLTNATPYFITAKAVNGSGIESTGAGPVTVIPHP